DVWADAHRSREIGLSAPAVQCLGLVSDVRPAGAGAAAFPAAAADLPGRDPLVPLCPDGGRADRPLALPAVPGPGNEPAADPRQAAAARGPAGALVAELEQACGMCRREPARNLRAAALVLPQTEAANRPSADGQGRAAGPTRSDRDP